MDRLRYDAEHRARHPDIGISALLLLQYHQPADELPGSDTRLRSEARAKRDSIDKRIEYKRVEYKRIEYKRIEYKRIEYKQKDVPIRGTRPFVLPARHSIRVRWV